MTADEIEALLNAGEPIPPGVHEIDRTIVIRTEQPSGSSL